MKTQRTLHLSRAVFVTAIVAVAAAAAGVVHRHEGSRESGVRVAGVVPSSSAEGRMQARRLGDIAAMEKFRPAYPFWKHVFLIPDGAIVIGSAADGRRLAVIRAASESRRESVAREIGRASCRERV